MNGPPCACRGIDRRAFLSRAAGGVGLLSLAHLLNEELPHSARAADSATVRAKSVICLFQHGGPSHIDLCDPKPALKKWHGQPYPDGEVEVHFHGEQGNVLASPFNYHKCGDSGIELSELLPYTGQIADDITLIRSMTTDVVDHENALRLIHTGRVQAGFPTWGSWVVYGLGNESHELPAYLVLSDPGGLPVDGSRNWSSGWLPAVTQGTVLRTSDPSPIVNLQMPPGTRPEARAQQLQFLDQLNRHHREQFPENQELAARIANFELAARMQTAIPHALDLAQETAAIQQMYGLDRPETREYGTRCLLARRLVERGVRFVQLFLQGQPWDTHSNNDHGHRDLCARTDQPVAALVRDLKQRGLLESTIVIWGGEFGRLPISQKENGRDHNRHGFSLWIAGGGFKSGYVHGATDDFGYKAVENIVTVHDLHATLLQALGLNHRRLAFPHDGIQTTLTDVSVTKARVIADLLA